MDSYEIKFNLKTNDAMISLWCQAKGYQSTIQQHNAQGALESVPNPESEKEFFNRISHQELMNVMVSPIQNKIYMDANNTAQQQVQQITEDAKNNMTLIIEKIEIGND